MSNRARKAATLTAITGLVVVGTAVGVSLYAFSHARPGPAASPSTAVPSHRPVAVRPLSTSQVYLGVFQRGDTASYLPVERFANAVGMQPNIILCYTAWGGPFEMGFAERAAAHRAVPFVQMLPHGVSMASIADGQSDGYLRRYARSVRAYGHPVILSFAPEMNGWWYPWSHSHTPPGTWIAAWRHVVTVFRQQRASNVTWLWTVNRRGGRTVSIGRYWPGQRYVTWIGIDGYYFTRRQTFTQIFRPTIRQARKLSSVPILLSETSIGQLAGQAHSMPNLFAGIRRYHLIGLVWFDAAQHGGPYHQDWQLEGHPAAVAAFRRGLQTLKAQKAA
jgi:mannan endo-1,4-beta-mannosidase